MATEDPSKALEDPGKPSSIQMDPAKEPVGALIKRLTAPQLWGLGGAFVTVVLGSFGAGYWIGNRPSPGVAERSTTCPAGVIDGDVRLSNSGDVLAVAPCSEITGELVFSKTVRDVSLPNLEHVGRGIKIDDSNERLSDLALLRSLRLPSLRRVDGGLNVDCDSNASLEEISLEAIERVGGLFNLEGTRVESLQMPSLTSVGGDFNISGNAALLAIDASRLATVGGNFHAGGNSKLPTCRIQQIRDQLVDFRGATNIARNGDGGACR